MMRARRRPGTFSTCALKLADRTTQSWAMRRDAFTGLPLLSQFNTASSARFTRASIDAPLRELRMTWQRHDLTIQCPPFPWLV